MGLLGQKGGHGVQCSSILDPSNSSASMGLDSAKKNSIGEKMILKQIARKQTIFIVSLMALALAGALSISAVPSMMAQAPGQAPAAAPAGPPTAVKLDMADGSTASYRVQEQLAGINFPSEAIGSSPTLTGTIMLKPDGSIDSSQSKLSFDLRTLKSDQDMRDGYIQKRTLETDKFPTAEFVPTKIQGVPTPLPVMGQAGIQLTGNLTVHGVTSEVTWNGVTTFSKDGVAGRASTDFMFGTFGLTKPTLARLLSVDDKIHLELVFRMKRS
jgi:polyisoprenoid-binding protein YceI